MKTVVKLFSALLVIITLLSVNIMNAQDVVITKSQLPKTSQNFIDKYFKDKKIGYVEQDKDVFDKDYKVKFTGGTKIKFESNGEWDEVDGEHKAIPTGFISNKIVNYVNKNFPNDKITKIDKSYFKIEVELLSGIELIFNKKGDFQRIDD